MPLKEGGAWTLLPNAVAISVNGRWGDHSFALNCFILAKILLGYFRFPREPL